MKARLRTQIAGNKRMTYKLDIVNIARRGPFSPHNLVDDKRSLEERERILAERKWQRESIIGRYTLVIIQAQTEWRDSRESLCFSSYRL